MAPTADEKMEHNRAVEDGIVEKGAFSPSPATSVLSKAFLTGPIQTDWTDLILLTHSFVTGMVDAATFSNWAVFVGMQTGNTVILGLSTTTIASNPHAWLTTLISLASFLLGAFLTFRLTAYLIPTSSNPPISHSRLYLFSILLLQALLILLAAALTTPSNLVPQNPTGKFPVEVAEATLRNTRIVSLIPPLAFQSGMQIATSRLLGFNELPVNVLTSTYCDLMGDARLFVAHANPKRNRRAASVLLLLAGSIVSGWLMRSSAGLMGVFWLAGGIKALAAVGALVLLRRAASASVS